MQGYALKHFELNSEVAAKRPEGGQTPGLLKIKNACRGAWLVFLNKRCLILSFGIDMFLFHVRVENREVINRVTVVSRRG